MMRNVYGKIIGVNCDAFGVIVTIGGTDVIHLSYNNLILKQNGVFCMHTESLNPQ